MCEGVVHQIMLEVTNFAPDTASSPNLHPIVLESTKFRPLIVTITPPRSDEVDGVTRVGTGSSCISNSVVTTLGMEADPISKLTTPEDTFGVKQVIRVLLILSVGETVEPMRQKFNVLSKDVPKMLTRYPPSPYTMLGLNAVTTGPSWKSNRAPPSTKLDVSLTS